MWCDKHKATISIKICIMRQELAQDKNHNPKIGTFNKCIKCRKGKKIKNNPKLIYDADWRKLIREYEPKPKRLQLQKKKPKKYKLKRKKNERSR